MNGAVTVKMNARRTKGTGSVYRDKRGGWFGQVKIDGRAHSVRGRTKTEVQTKLNAVIAQSVTGTMSTDKSMTVAQLMDRFITRSIHSRRGGSLAPMTRRTHQWAAAHITELLGKKRIADLTRSHVEAALDKLAAGGLSRRSVRMCLLTLQLALDSAVAEGTCIRNVARLAELPPVASEPRKRAALKPADAVRIAEQLPDQPLGVMFLLMLRCGLRPGEASAVHWDDLDGDVLHIRHGLQRDGGRVEIVQQLKTKSSERPIRLPSEVVAAIARHRKQQTRDRLAAPLWLHPELMFTSSNGGIIDPANLRRAWKAICRDLDVTVTVGDKTRPPTPNELRHSCVSMLAYLGIPNEQIAALVGHTTTRMIEQTYGHRLTDAVDTAVVAWSVRK
jgi:integrase